MTPLKQAIAWWCFVPRKLTPEALLRAAADLGYAAVELVDPEYWPLVKQYGLKMASHRGHGGDDAIINGMNRRENRESIRQALREQIAPAGAARTNCAGGGVGNPESGVLQREPERSG